MTLVEQNRFKNVITQLINAPGNPNPYGTLVGHHANHVHNMHPFMGAVAAQGFLPWHRAYVLKVEQMGQALDPLFLVPYWKWPTQRAVPPWLAEFKPTVRVPGTDRTVTRNPPRPRTTLPTSPTMAAVSGLGAFRASSTASMAPMASRITGVSGPCLTSAGRPWPHYSGCIMPR